MRTPHRPIVALLFLLQPLAAYAAPAPPVAPLKRVLDAADPHRIDADLRFLADDVMEGRGTGQKGGRLAALYLEDASDPLAMREGDSIGLEVSDPATGEQIVGREAIQKEFEEAFSDKKDVKLSADIESIEFAWVNEIVYDLTVEEDHSFVTLAGVAYD